MNSEVKELHNALITIKGNALRCGDSIYSIHNIVSITFDSVRKENECPAYVKNISYLYGFFSFYCLLILVLIFLIDKVYIDKYIEYVAWSAGASFLLVGILSPFHDNAQKKYEKNRYYFTDGLRIIFINNSSLFLVSNSTTGFIKETVDRLYSFISNPELTSKNELTINFSDSSININEAVSSNIIGGSVQGDVKNG